MRHTIYIPIALILIVVSLVAIVRAQQSGGWSGNQVGQPQGSVASNQPNRIAPQQATQIPSPFAAQTFESMPRVQPSQSRFAQQPSLPPLMIENRYATDPTYNQPLPPPSNAILQTSATEPSPSDQPASSRRRPEVQQAFTNANGGAAIQEPARLAQATEPLTPTNQSQSIYAGPTSRRPRAPQQVEQPQNNEPTPAEPPRMAQRDDEPQLPPLDPQTADTAPVQTAPVETAPVETAPVEQAPAITEPKIQSAANRVLFQAEAPSLSVTLGGPAKIGVGKTVTYEIDITNNSRVEAEDVVVNLDLPGWADVTTSEATLGAARHEAIIGDNSRIKWSIFRLAAGATEKLTLKLVARESRSFELAVNWNHAAKTHLAMIEVQEPKLEMAMAGPRDVMYGETKTYTITIANPGTGPAENVVINLLPIAPGQDKAGVSNLGTIEPGARREIEIDLTARQAGDLELRAQAFAEGGLRTETAQQIHVRRGALEAVIGGPEVKYAGTVATYQVRVSNTGDAMAENVIAEAVLPRNATFVSASDGGKLKEAQGRIQWQVGGLRPGATRVVELRCVLAEAGSNRLEIVTAADDDLTSAAHWVTNVESLADLKLLINDPPGPIPAGEPMVYEVRIVNRGTKAAEGVQIASFFSQGIEPLSVEGGRAEIGIGQVIFSPIGRIAAGQEVVYRITAKAETGGDHTFRTQVVCTSPETNLAAQETTRFYGGSIDESLRPTASLPKPKPPTANLPSWGGEELRGPTEASLTPPNLPPANFEERR